jgi:hypothetical protein
MSIADKPESAGPHDPLHYAPRRLRDQPQQRLAAVEPIRSIRERRPEPPGRAISPPAPIDNQLENAVYESLRRPLDPQVLSETRALTREFERRGSTLFGISGRVAAAIGISAIIALFFVIMLPAARQPDKPQSFSAAVQSFTTALSQQHPAEDAKPALAEFQSLLTSGNTAQAAEQQPAPDQQGDKTLQQLLNWRKTTPGDAAQ